MQFISCFSHISGKYIHQYLLLNNFYNALFLYNPMINKILELEMQRCPLKYLEYIDALLRSQLFSSADFPHLNFLVRPKAKEP